LTTPLRLVSLGRPGAALVAGESRVCRSPVAGTVAKIPIQVGQSIKVNDVLMVLEAMKMETVITAPIAGKVARINGNVGDFVQGGRCSSSSSKYASSRSRRIVAPFAD
jgi:biotin carboxyl carrier protein